MTNLKLTGAFVLLAIILTSIAAYATPQTMQTVEPVFAAPSFELIDLDDENHTLDQYKGKPVIINFWATWCPPCREEMPSMERAWQKIEDEGIAMLGINVGEDFDTVFGFTGEIEMSFPLLLDLDGKATQQWPIRGLPTTFVLDPQGRVIYQAIGGREWDDEGLLDVVRSLAQ